jgi:hypothetical protein
MIGFTLVMSGGVIWNMRSAGLLLVELPTESIARPARCFFPGGLLISLPTGFALFAPRASCIAFSGSFQLKMALLLFAVAF